jgi:RHS repeat-associated protein
MCGTENRLTSVTVNGQATQFVYDGDGNRVKKVSPSGTVAYVGSHYEYNVSTGVATSYYYAGSTRVAMRQGGVVSYLHGDHLGSASLTTDANGAPTSQLRYLPYGAPRPGYPTGSVPTDYRFTGQRSEEASLGSLYDYGARMYSPVLGRFLSADTLVPSPGNPQSLNRYSYVYNNPLKFIDPTGYFAEEDLIKWYGQDMVDIWRQDQKWWGTLLQAEIGDTIFSLPQIPIGGTGTFAADKSGVPYLAHAYYAEPGKYLQGEGEPAYKDISLFEFSQHVNGVSYVGIGPGRNVAGNTAIYFSDPAIKAYLMGDAFDTVSFVSQLVATLAAPIPGVGPFMYAGGTYASNIASVGGVCFCQPKTDPFDRLKSTHLRRLARILIAENRPF